MGSDGNIKTFVLNCFGRYREATESLSVLMERRTSTQESLETISKREARLWRSIWVRTSKYQHDILFSSMKLFAVNVPFEVNYTRPFEDLLVEIIAALNERNYPPMWLLIGHRIPVFPFSGLIPMLPKFTAHQTPIYSWKGERLDANILLCGVNKCCQDILLKVKVIGASKEHGHIVCGKIMKLVRSAKVLVREEHTPGTQETWNHTRKLLLSYAHDDNYSWRKWAFKVDPDAEQSDTDASSPESDIDDLLLPRTPDHTPFKITRKARAKAQYQTAICHFDGKLGPYLVWAGDPTTKESHGPMVFFFDKTEIGNVQKVGTGLLYFSRIGWPEGSP